MIGQTEKYRGNEVNKNQYLDILKDHQDYIKGRNKLTLIVRTLVLINGGK